MLVEDELELDDDVDELVEVVLVVVVVVVGTQLSQSTGQNIDIKSPTTLLPSPQSVATRSLHICEGS